MMEEHTVPHNPFTHTECAKCGKVILESEGTQAGQDGELYCRDCLIANYVQCPTCFEWVSPRDLRENGTHCIGCEGDHYCTHCGHFVTEDSISEDGKGCALCAEKPTCHHCGGDIAEDGFTLQYNRRAFYFCCEECAELEGFHQCEECGEWLPENKLEDVDGLGLLCPDCLEDKCVRCENCGEWVDKDDARETQDGFYCEDCFDENFAECCRCGEVVRIEDGEEIGNDFYCEDCRDECFTQCADCGEWVDNDHIIRREDGEYICEGCYCESYFTCEECGEVFHIDYARYDEETEENLCPWCQESRQPSGLHPYGYKPHAIFHREQHEEGKPCLYMGIELELSHADNGDRDSNLEECHTILNPGKDEENVYTKQDSSLDHGFEIVSHPRTLASWHTFQPTMEKYLDEAREYTTGDRDGLHIHLSKKGMTDSHKVRFGAFVAEYQNEIVTIARRRSDWSTYIDRATNGREAAAMASNHGSRYEAVNWYNPSTVELRIFKATIDPVEFYACLEFSHALYQFTKRMVGIVEIMKGGAWEKFLRYIKGNPRYSNLYAYLVTAYSEGTYSSPDNLTTLTTHKKIDTKKAA